MEIPLRSLIFFVIIFICNTFVLYSCGYFYHVLLLCLYIKDKALGNTRLTLVSTNYMLGTVCSIHI